MKRVILRLGRYTFQYGSHPPGARGRRWMCGVQRGPAGPLGAGGCRTPLGALLSCLRFEREQAAIRRARAA
jgi:hypothetical protein